MILPFLAAERRGNVAWILMCFYAVALVPAGYGLVTAPNDTEFSVSVLPPVAFGEIHDACVVEPPPQSARATPMQQDQQSIIYIFRLPSWETSGETVGVSYDGARVGEIFDGTYLAWRVSPGKHIATSAIEHNKKHASVEVDTVSGGIYYIKVYLGHGIRAGKITMEIVSKEAGESEISKRCKPMEPSETVVTTSRAQIKAENEASAAKPPAPSPAGPTASVPGHAASAAPPAPVSVPAGSSPAPAVTNSRAVAPLTDSANADTASDCPGFAAGIPDEAGHQLALKVCEAVWKGNVAETRSLLQSGVDPNAYRYSLKKWTLLLLAVRFGHKDTVEFLLVNGADVNAKDVDGETPLHTAVELFNRGSKPHKEIVKLLIAHNADLHARDRRGVTPFELAESSGRKDIVELFPATAPDVDAAYKDGDSSPKIYVRPMTLPRNQIALLMESGGLLVVKIDGQSVAGRRPIELLPGSHTLEFMPFYPGECIYCEKRFTETLSAKAGVEYKAKLKIEKVGPTVKSPVPPGSIAGQVPRITETPIRAWVEITTKP